MAPARASSRWAPARESVRKVGETGNQDAGDRHPPEPERVSEREVLPDPPGTRRPVPFPLSDDEAEQEKPVRSHFGSSRRRGDAAAPPVHRENNTTTTASQPSQMMKRILPIIVLTGFSCLLLDRYFAMFNAGIFSDLAVMTSKGDTDSDYFSVTKLDDDFNDSPSQQHDVTEKLEPHQKFYVIHIGPPKTGSSTFQSHLVANPFESNTFGEEKDNVIYVGKRAGTEINPWGGEHKNKKIRFVVDKMGNQKSILGEDEREAYLRKVKCCTQILDKSRVRSNDLDTDEAVRTSLREQFISDCWKGGNNKDDHKVDFSYMLNYNIVDSDEGYSKRAMVATAKRNFRVFDILGYELIVVGVYRRYAEWIMSTYGQSLRKRFLTPNLKGKKKNVPCTPLSFFLNNLERNSGDTKFGARFYKNLDWTLPAIRATGPPKLEVKTMNYFQLPHSNYNAESAVKSYDTITTELYCDVLDMPYSCKNNLEKAKSKATKNSANVQSTADAAYQQIVAYGYLLGYLLPNKKKSVERLSSENEENIRKMLDKITSGGKTSIVGTNSSNITMYKDLSVYHTTVHKANPGTSLPYICPGKQQLENLLHRSLELEKLLVPEFYASPLGEAEHKRLFWDVWLKEKKKFCWVDIERLFQSAQSWDEIIDHRMVNIDWDAENGSIGERK